MRETWYKLEDGRTVDPNDVAPDGGGALRHKSGVAVAVGPHGPRSRGVDETEMAAYRDVQAKADADAMAAAEHAAKAKVLAGEITSNEARAAAGMPPVEPAKAISPSDRQVTPGNGKNKTR